VGAVNDSLSLWREAGALASVTRRGIWTVGACPLRLTHTTSERKGDTGRVDSLRQHSSSKRRERRERESEAGEI
jgi:hypothetical protein